MDLKEMIELIDASVKRRKSNFVIGPAPIGESPPFMLAAGSFRALYLGGKQSPYGFLVTMGITRERLVELRDACNALLGD